MEQGLSMGTVALTAVGVVFVYFLFLIISHLVKSAQRTDKLPESYPFQNTIRCALEVQTILDFILRCQQDIKEQESGCLNLFSLPWMVFTRNIENITFVLKEIDTFGKGPLWIERFHGLLGQGIFNSDGEVWYKHRKVSANLFKLSSFKNEILDTFHNHCSELIGVLREKPAGTKIDIQVSIASCDLLSS
jgi:cytochrome P450